MSDAISPLAAYRTALHRLAPFTAIHFAVRLIAAAIFVPLMGLLLSLAIATSDQSALTDQDIASFLLTPAGAAGLLVLAGLGIVSAVLDVTLMTHTIRQGGGMISVLASGLGLVTRRFSALFRFGALLTLRVLALSLPFVAVAGGLWLLVLSDYDINYYLTYHPPEFVITSIAIGIILLALAIVLLMRLTSWSIALHLVLFRRTPPSAAFRDSADMMHGARSGLVGRTAGWGVLLWVLKTALTLFVGLLSSGAYALFGDDLGLVAMASVVILGLWLLADAVISAWGYGALSVLLFDAYTRRTGEVPPPAKDHASPYRAFAVAAVLLVVLGVAGGGLDATLDRLDRVTAVRTVEIIAHRGAAASRPENTMASVEKALDDHADWVEIDVQETADGEVVVAHDSDFMKLGGNPLKVWDSTMEDIAGIDIGSWFGPDYADQRTPTLRQVLELAKARDGQVIIELKYYGHDVALEQKVADIVDSLDMGNSIAVMSLKLPGVRKMQALRPDWTSGILAATAIGDLSGLQADFLAVNTGQVSVSLIDRAHDRGQKLYVWTVDDAPTMSRMISMGVDGLITNEPALARQVMDARNDLSTAERLLLWLGDRFRLGRGVDLVAEERDA
ncbi:Glycerophosphoryl diester phosphodiesterase (plasmid) [Paracoccaceae bacterium]|nr:Glycerophosphoryl diester phosphodiesterase [Paracoccaceae bacterium]